MSLMFDDEPDMSAIVERLADEDAEVRCVAVMDLREIDEVEAMPMAIQALSDPSAEVRTAAAQVMDEYTGSEIAEALVKALSDEDENVRTAAAATLAENKNDAAGPILLNALSQEDPFIKAACLRAMRVLCLPQAQGPALECLTHPDASVRREAVGVLAYLKSEDVLIALMNAARRDADETVRRVAMGSLVFSKNEKATETLISGLHDVNWQVREEAAFVIGKVGQTAALDALIDAISQSR